MVAGALRQLENWAPVGSHARITITIWALKLVILIRHLILVEFMFDHVT